MNILIGRENVWKSVEKEKFFNGETLFIGGGASDYIKQSDRALLKTHFPKAKIEMIPEAGHWVHAVKPIELFQSVENFLSK